MGLSLVMAVACSALASVEMFTPRAIFQPPLAHPRSPEFFAQTDLNTGFTQFSVAMGARMPLVTYTPEFWPLPKPLVFQFGFDAGVWSELGRAGKNLDSYFPVFSADYLAGLVFMARYGEWALDAEASHISAHLVDGSPFQKRIVYSREYWRVRLSRDFQFGNGSSIRLYAGYGNMVRTLPRRIGDFMVGGGVEVVSQRLAWFRPFFAADVTYNDDAKRGDFSLQWGTFITRHDDEILKVRLALEYYDGSDRRGQFLGDLRRRFGMGLYARF